MLIKTKIPCRLSYFTWSRFRGQCSYISVDIVMMKGRVEVAIMVSAFVIVAGCFSIPIIVYAIHSRGEDDVIARHDILYKLNLDSCPQQVRRLQSI